jgi:hypothetical protein
MIRKLLLATLFILQISIMPSWGAETVLVDRVSSAEAEELDIQIPADVPPGYHEVIIEVYDDGGVLDKKVLEFCKEINGTIDWASNCPDLVRIYSEPELITITERSELPAYDPAQEPDKSKDLQVTAFAALAALSAAGAAAGSQKSGSDTNARREEDNSSKDGTDEDSDAGSEDKSDEESDDLASVSAGDLKKIERDPGRGDLSRTWRAPLTERTDALFAALITRISPHSPILARTIADGNYLRAIFGSLSSLLLIPGALATLDAMAGLVSGLIFTAGVVLSGNFASRDEILTIAGLFIIFYAPALLASAIRPLRRLAQDRDSHWERATDYGLVTLLSGWMMFKMIGALNALAGVQLVISFAARDIAILASAFILIRLLLEDLTTYLYPVRLNKSAGKFLEPDTIQKVISLEIKLFIFIEIAKPFVGYNLKLVLGTIIFAIPSIISIFFDDRFPKIPIIHRLLPSGAFKIVAMVFIGTLAAGFIQGLFSDARSFLAWSFVVLAIPGLILSLLGKMAKKPAKDWKTSPVGNTAYRILGFLVFLAIIQIVRGVDLYAAVFGK